MKTLNKVLSIVLCFVILAAFAPMVYAESALITSLSATYSIPAAGEPMDFDSVEVPSGARYTAKIENVYYYNYAGGEYIHINDGDTVKEGITYRVRIRFTAESFYKISTTAEYYINGEEAKSLAGTAMPEVTFVAKAAEPDTPDEPTPVRVSFWQKIVDFFRTIRFFIRRLFVKLLGK